jgi:phosphomannomutase/phosphoglucomutase
MKLPSLGKKTDAGEQQTPDAAAAPKLSKKRPKKAPARGISLASISALMMVGALLVLSLFAAAAYYYQQYQSGLLQDVEAKQQAGQLADAVEVQLKNISARMEVVATDKRVLAAVSSGNDQQREALATEFSAAFPGIWTLRLMSSDVVSTNSDLEPPLGYADLDMLNRSVSSGKTVPAEVHGMGSKMANVVLVQPVINPLSGDVVGHIMAYYHQRDLNHWLTKGKSFPGKLELVQSIDGGSSLSLFAAGNVGETPSATHSFAVPGANWRLQATADLGHGSASVETLMALGAMLLTALALSAMLVYGLHGRYRKALRSDLATVKRFLDGREAASVDAVQVQVEELRETVSALWQTDADSSYSGTEALAPQAGVDLELDLIDTDEVAPAMPSVELPMQIFRAYDIRGVVGVDFTAEIVQALGQAFGTEAYEQGQQTVVVGRDGRLSGQELSSALIAGIRNSGRDVKDLGVVPTPVLYFATHFLGSSSGVMLTGSHNPPEYNGLKMVLNGDAMTGASIYELRERLRMGNLLGGHGDVDEIDIVADYISRVSSDINVERPLRLVVDCGNGSASDVAPELLRELGCDVTEIFCDVDGEFPNHHPDPSDPKNLETLIKEVRGLGADLGIAFDGDGDRIGVVDSAGAIIWPDRLMMLFAQDVLLRNPGAIIIYDVKSSAKLGQFVLQNGGRGLMWKSGHSLIKARMKETGALLAGEFSGHICFKERWFGFDDALYAAARLVELLSYDPRTSAEVFEELPNSLSTPELKVALPEGRSVGVMDALVADHDFGDGRVTDIDGLRVEYSDSWGLVRASNTTPTLTFRFEADDKSAMRRVQDVFRSQILKVDPSIALPF